MAWWISAGAVIADLVSSFPKNATCRHLLAPLTSGVAARVGRLQQQNPRSLESERQSSGWVRECLRWGGGRRSRLTATACGSSVEQAGAWPAGGGIPPTSNALLPALLTRLQNEIEPLPPGPQQPARGS